MNGDFWRGIGQDVVEDIADGPDQAAEVIYLEPPATVYPWSSWSTGEKIAAAGVVVGIVALLVRR